MIQISFVVSDVMNSLPLGLNARLTGLKQRFGQLLLLELYMILNAAVVEVTGSVGMPVTGSQAMRETR